MQRTLDSDLLNLEEQQPRHEDSDFFQDVGGGASPLLPQIEEDEEDEANKDEAQKCVRVANDGKTIELISPQQKTVLKIRNAKIPITSNALRYQELKHIEDTIVSMQAMPDFGYDGDNFVIERSQDAPRNWKLLTDFVYNKDKYEWL